MEVLELVHQLQYCIKDLPEYLKDHGQLIKDLKEAIPSSAEQNQLSTFDHALRPFKNICSNCDERKYYLPLVHGKLLKATTAEISSITTLHSPARDKVTKLGKQLATESPKMVVIITTMTKTTALDPTYKSRASSVDQKLAMQAEMELGEGFNELQDGYFLGRRSCRKEDKYEYELVAFKWRRLKEKACDNRYDTDQYFQFKIKYDIMNPLYSCEDHEEMFPMVARLARQYCSIPGSSVRLKEPFSQDDSGEKRAQLDPDTLRDMFVSIFFSASVPHARIDTIFFGWLFDF
ncbi:MAG: hypothetical protein BYD32DRAFT_437670 [Podila humilis]|nr:MAG: hypothetical protein BYD32DRAFT_437670 [Podila humilis]